MRGAVLCTRDVAPCAHCLTRARVCDAGLEKPSAIQQRALVPILKGRDVIAQSQSGTGKTTIFCIGVLQSINTRSRETQALVLSPTRELAEQSRNVRALLSVATHLSPSLSLSLRGGCLMCVCVLRRR